MLGIQVISKAGAAENGGRMPEQGENVRDKLIPLCSSGWNCDGGNHFRPPKMTSHAILAAVLCFQVAALCICCSHGSSPLAVLWLLQELFSVHMPRRLISHNLLIPGSRQMQQMLLLPLLLNKVESREKEIYQYCFSAGTKINTVCGILSDSNSCAKSPFCVTYLCKIGICPYIS